jgi:spore coat polysaccharide biosynthesis protein SpsF (cytidylyltransferase family)
VTSENPADDPIEAACEQAGVRCIRGDEHDVLDRFHVAMVQLAPERVLRITADCPLLDPAVISDLLALADGRGELDYACVATGAITPEGGLRRFPDGLDAEVINAAALEHAWREARDPFEREHVTPFVWRRPERFPSAMLEAEADFGGERWTVDFPGDLAFVRAVYEHFGDREFGWREVLALLEREPELRALNDRHRVAAD